jgi:hypothetical protein
MKINIEFDTDNAAFEDDRLSEVTRIMTLAKIEALDCLNDGCGIRVPIKDSNGNRVGVLEIVM